MPTLSQLLNFSHDRKVSALWVADFPANSYKCPRTFGHQGCSKPIRFKGNHIPMAMVHLSLEITRISIWGCVGRYFSFHFVVLPGRKCQSFHSSPERGALFFFHVYLYFHLWAIPIEAFQKSTCLADFLA
jgi:hypothetical protein